MVVWSKSLSFQVHEYNHECYSRCAELEPVLAHGYRFVKFALQNGRFVTFADRIFLDAGDCDVAMVDLVPKMSDVFHAEVDAQTHAALVRVAQSGTVQLSLLRGVGL